MKTITFYSYKGGVGRSLALANIATRLLEFDRNVCLLDFDLEAPGLPLKFNHLTNAINPKRGIVDYIYSFTNQGILPKKIKDYTLQVPVIKSAGKLSLIPAGNIDSPSYWQKLSAINWHDFLFENKNGLSFFLDLKEKIRKEINPDFLLIDSRTGISEISGISLSLLADEVVIVAANNRENIEGVKKIIKTLTNSKESILGKPIKLIFVLSRIPFTDNPEDKAKEQNLVRRIKNEFSDFFNDDINIIHSDRDLEVYEQIKIGYEKDDSAAQISRDYLKLFEKLTENELTKEERERFSDIKYSEQLFLKARHITPLTQKIELLKQAISLNPTNIEFITFKGICYEQLGDYLKASEDFKLALSIDPNALEPRLRLAHIGYKNGDNENAIRYFKEMLELDENNYDAYIGVGLVYSKKHDFETSIKWYDKAIKLDPSIFIGYNNIADAYTNLGNYDKALEYVYKSLELNSGNAMAYATLAEINACLNNINEFYLNLEISFKFGAAEEFKEEIFTNNIYSKFMTEPRMLRLLEKYNIV